MKPIISVKNLSKKFQIREKTPYYSLRDSLTNLIRNAAKNNTEKNDFIWALKDISFDIYPGEVIGIIGRNGSGKSTLLKILSQITPPTLGTVTIEGRVASLLEVGTGFHPELTGRENIYLNGAVLGMSRKEIKDKFDEIVDFAEIKKFLDTPIKHYSSGMQTRLGFAVAAHLDSDILIIDEVLSVGDVEFQKKSNNEIEKIKKRGKTIIIVSHNLLTISQYCSKAFLINSGLLVGEGNPKKVVDEYYQLMDRKYPKLISADRYDVNTARPICIRKINIKTILDKKNNLFDTGDDLVLEIYYLQFRKIENIAFGISIFNGKGEYIFGTNTDIDNYNLELKRKNGKITLILKDLNLLKGEYLISVGIAIDNNWQFPVEQIMNTAWFKIKGNSYTTAMEGSTLIDHEWKSK